MAKKQCIISGTQKKLCLLALLFFLLIAFVLLPPGKNAVPDFCEKTKSASRELNQYDLSLKLNPEDATLSISETIAFRNDTGKTLDNIVLRTWLNAFETEESSPAATEELYDACYPNGFSAGFLTLFDVEWNGEKAEYAYLDEEKTALSLRIPPLSPGEEGKIFLRCVAFLPECAHRVGVTEKIWQLNNAIPLLSVYENGAWRSDAYAPVGDPFVSECANFTISLTLPEGYYPACTAYLTKTGENAWKGTALAVRDVGLCVSPLYVTQSALQGKTLVTAFAESEKEASRALKYARQALQTFSDLYGEYPYPCYTVCLAHFPLGGMEYPGLTMIDSAYFSQDKQDSLELLLAHETAHQWFYALVGSDQFRQPWQDEALSEYAMLRYVQKRYGQSSFETLKTFRVDAPMREAIPGSLTPGSPIDYFPSLSDYVSVVYGRGAALMLALNEIVPGGADGFLKAYAEKNSFSYVSRGEFEEFLCEYAGLDAKPLVTDYLDTVME